MLVLVEHRPECGVEGLAETGGEVVLHLPVLIEVGLQDQRAEGRRQRQGVDGRNTYGHGHRDTELGVERSRRTAHHRHGDEHRHEDQRRGDDGRRDARHGVDGGHVGGLVPGVEAGLDRLDDDDGVVDDRTDRKHQGEERQQVDREAGHRKEGKRTDQRNENRHRGDEGRADILQEDVDHKYHEDDGLDQRLDYLVDRGEEEVVDAHHVHDLHPFREVLAGLVEQGVDVLDDGCGVRAGCLEDHGRHARVAVHAALEGVGLLAQLDFGHILEPQHCTVLVRENNQVAELLGGVPAAAVLHLILVDILRVGTQRTRGGLDVLLGEDGRDVAGHQLVLGHHVGLQPDADRVVGAHCEGLADALDTLELGLDVDFRVVRQEGLVVGIVGADEGEDLQHGGLALHRRDTDRGHLAREHTGSR